MTLTQSQALRLHSMSLKNQTNSTRQSVTNLINQAISPMEAEGRLLIGLDRVERDAKAWNENRRIFGRQKR